MNITINITGLDLLAQAINNLANALQDKNTSNLSVSTPISAPVQTQVIPQPVPPVQQTPVMTQPVPTTTVTYTLDELSKAGVSLMDKGMQSELMQLVNSFGVSSLVELPKNRYGEFATALRGLGAAI